MPWAAVVTRLPVPNARLPVSLAQVGEPPHVGLLVLLLSGVGVLLLVGAWQTWRNRDR